MMRLLRPPRSGIFLRSFRLHSAHSARCTAEIGGATFSSPCTVDVAFKRPIAFCARIVLESWMADRRAGFIHGAARGMALADTGRARRS